VNAYGGASIPAEILAYTRAAYPQRAAQTRIVSKARIRLDSRKSMRPFKGIICVDISEFESYMPSHAVGLSQVRSPRNRHAFELLDECSEMRGKIVVGPLNLNHGKRFKFD
jgi:hypothetical protein